MSIEKRFRMSVGVSLFLLVTISVANAQYSGGSGTADDPYQIATAADLIALGESPEDYDRHFVLTADIDLDPNLPGQRVFDRAVIAPEPEVPFTGMFDGRGHRVLNMSISGVRYIGLFGSVGADGEVLNLGLDRASVAGATGSGWAPVGAGVSHFKEEGEYVAGLVGLNGGHVTGCYCAGVVTGETNVGAIAGRNYGSVVDCYSTGAVSGGDCIGGLVGCNEHEITKCYSTGLVRGSSVSAVS